MGCLISHHPPPKNRLLALLPRSLSFLDVRERNLSKWLTTRSGGVWSNPESRYPLGLTVTGCLHKHEDAIKAKDPMYCRIWFLFPRSTLCVNFSKRGLKTRNSQGLNFVAYRLKAGIYPKAVLTSLNMAFLPLCRSRFKQRQIPLLITLTSVLLDFLKSPSSCLFSTRRTSSLARPLRDINNGRFAA